VELQKLADELGIEIWVSHLPPGTSKWNKIEHRLFSFISMNWRGKPLLTYQVVVNLIAATTTKVGLKVQAALDPEIYPSGIKVSDAVVKGLNLSQQASTEIGTIPCCRSADESKHLMRLLIPDDA